MLYASSLCAKETIPATMIILAFALQGVNGLDFCLVVPK